MALVVHLNGATLGLNVALVGHFHVELALHDDVGFLKALLHIALLGVHVKGNVGGIGGKASQAAGTKLGVDDVGIGPHAFKDVPDDRAWVSYSTSTKTYSLLGNLRGGGCNGCDRDGLGRGQCPRPTGTGGGT